MNHWMSALLIILLISLVPNQSNASVLDFVRKLVQTENPKQKPSTESPAPSPVPPANLEPSTNSGEAESCDKVVDKCEIKEYNTTACVPSVGNGFQGSYLLVLNKGENSLKLDITFSPTNDTTTNIVIPEHQVKKVNMSSTINGSSSILLKAENGNCMIHLGGSVWQVAAYTKYLTPVNGTYLLFVTALFVGGTWACCKLVKRERHLDGVLYRELEMGHKDSKSSLNVETADSWDQRWDDDWDEEKAVKSPAGGNKRLQNGFALRHGNSNGRVNDKDA